MRPLNIIFIFLLSSTLLLAGCTTTSTQPPPQNQAVSWDSRVQNLSRIQAWNLKGSIAIRSRQEANSASLQWQQSQRNYTISLFGPLGTQSYVLTGKPGQVDLEMSDGKKFSATTPEILLAEQTGWRLPVSNLYYWVRGLPVPGVPAQKQFDAYHHLTQLSQQGWNIQYLNYVSINNIDIPNKISLNNPQLNVKIVIRQWEF